MEKKKNRTSYIFEMHYFTGEFMQEKKKNEEHQLVVSETLLCVLSWLLKYEEKNLKSLVVSAFCQGMEEKSSEKKKHKNKEYATTVYTFFSFLESIVKQSASDISQSKHMNQEFLNHLSKISIDEFGYDIVKKSIVQSAKNNSKASHMHSIFLKELLKNWKPSKKNKKFYKH